MRVLRPMRPWMIEQEPDGLTRGLIGCGFLAPPTAIAVFTIAVSRAAGYDHVADTVSKLSAQGVPSGIWSSGLVLYSVLMGLFAMGLRRRFREPVSARFLWVSILVHALLMVGVALFRDDLRPGGFFTTEGAVHDILSGMAFSALVGAMLATYSMGRAMATLRTIRRFTLSVGSIMTAVGIGFLFTPPAVQGVPQRIFVALAATWICVLAARSGSLFGRTRKRRHAG